MKLKDCHEPFLFRNKLDMRLTSVKMINLHSSTTKENINTGRPLF